jgi:hypothetical protein
VGIGSYDFNVAGSLFAVSPENRNPVGSAWRGDAWRETRISHQELSEMFVLRALTFEEAATLMSDAQEDPSPPKADRMEPGRISGRAS